MFYTKSELLKFLGKNENDNKLVDRMIKRCEVIRLADGYELVEDDVEELKWKIKELEWKIEDLERKEEGTDGGRMQVSSSDLDLANHLSNDLEYLNREYEKLEGLLDYSLRKCYNIMKKKGLVGSEDIYDDFYAEITKGYRDNNITAWYQGKSEVKTDNEGSGSVVECGNGWEKDLGSIMNKFGIKKASDLI